MTTEQYDAMYTLMTWQTGATISLCLFAGVIIGVLLAIWTKQQ